MAAYETISHPKYPEVYVQNQPLGTTLCKIRELIIVGIVPWNFPIWLPFKIGIPALMLGNPVLLKHAESAPIIA
jgi:acyl-CoA reductase-like NAD-dependent aldehyde dehydrogenase